jgi:hypothetical protein
VSTCPVVVEEELEADDPTRYHTNELQGGLEKDHSGIIPNMGDHPVPFALKEYLSWL